MNPLRPRLTVNRQFLSDFLAVGTPCFAPGTQLRWACRDHPEYLDLTDDRLDSTPA